MPQLRIDARALVSGSPLARERYSLRGEPRAAVAGRVVAAGHEPTTGRLDDDGRATVEVDASPEGTWLVFSLVDRGLSWPFIMGDADEDLGTLAARWRPVQPIGPVPGPAGPEGPMGAAGPAGPEGPQGAYDLDIWRVAAARPPTPAGGLVDPTTATVVQTPVGWAAAPGVPGPGQQLWFSRTHVNPVARTESYVPDWTQPAQAGEQGPPGPEGPKGDKGDAGPQGEQGPAGSDGERGPQGAQGEQGPAGPQGPPGSGAAVADGSITTAKLADNAVTTAKLATDSVGPRELQPNSVRSGHITDASITSDDIARNQILERHIAAGNITQGLIDGNAVGTPELIDGAVTEAKLAQAVVDQLGGGGEGAPLGDRVLPVAGTSMQEAGDSSKAAREDHVHGLAVTNGLEFTATDQLQISAAIRNSIVAARQAGTDAATAAAAAALEASTVVRIGPPFIAGDTAQRNLYVSLEHPTGAYRDANILSVSVQGATPNLQTYDPGEDQATYTVGLTAAQMANLQAGGHLSEGDYVLVDVRLRQGRNGPVQFFRNVFVLVEAAVSGTRGPAGPQGPAGPAGPRGPAGAAGASVAAATIGGVSLGSAGLRNNQTLALTADTLTTIIMRNSQRLPAGAAYDNNTGILTLGVGTWLLVGHMVVSATANRGRVFPHISLHSDVEGPTAPAQLAAADSYWRFDPGGRGHDNITKLIQVFDLGSGNDSTAVTLRADFSSDVGGATCTVEGAGLDLIKLA